MKHNNSSFDQVTQTVLKLLRPSVTNMVEGAKVDYTVCLSLA